MLIGTLFWRASKFEVQTEKVLCYCERSESFGGDAKRNADRDADAHFSLSFIRKVLNRDSVGVKQEDRLLACVF